MIRKCGVGLLGMPSVKRWGEGLFHLPTYFAHSDDYLWPPGWAGILFVFPKFNIFFHLTENSASWAKNVQIQNHYKDTEVNTPILFTQFDYFDCIHLSLQLKASVANLIKLTGSFTEMTSQC
jgi:hypothetical protein